MNRIIHNNKHKGSTTTTTSNYITLTETTEQSISGFDHDINNVTQQYLEFIMVLTVIS